MLLKLLDHEVSGANSGSPDEIYEWICVKNITLDGRTLPPHTERTPIPVNSGR